MQYDVYFFIPMFEQNTSLTMFPFFIHRNSFGFGFVYIDGLLRGDCTAQFSRQGHVS